MGDFFFHRLFVFVIDGGPESGGAAAAGQVTISD